MLQIQVIEREEELKVIAMQWQILAENNAITPFQTFQWNLAWWQYVGSYDTSLTLHIILILKGGKICAIAPLMKKEVAGERILLFLSDPYADYHDLIIDTSIIDSRIIHAKLLEYFCQGFPKLWNKVELKELFSDSTLIEYLRTYSTINIKIDLVSSSQCPRLEINKEEVFTIASNKKEYVIKQRRLNKIGKLVCRHFTIAEQIMKRMPKFLEMHLKEWLPRNHRNHTFEDPTIKRFYNQSVGILASHQLLMLTELALDERPIAYYYGFVYKKVYWGYRPAFEIEFSKYSPGHVMHRLMFQYLQENNFTIFDFMRGNEGYKHRYANLEYHNTNVSMCCAS